MPLVTVIPALRPLLLALHATFSKPQQRHFDNYIQSLICQEHRRTLAAMSGHVLDGPDASAWDRFVTAAPWAAALLSDQWRRQLRQELQRLKPRSLRIAGRQTDFLIFDDTDHPRSGHALEGAGYHYRHSTGAVGFGHCLVTGAYRTGDYTFAYSCEPYVRELDVAALNAAQAGAARAAGQSPPPPREFRAKTDLVVAQIAAFRPLRSDRQVFVLVDSWYLNPRTTRAARARGLSWASCLKANRKVELLDLALDTGEVRDSVTLPVGELLDRMLPAAMLTEAGLPFPALAVAPGLQTFRVGRRDFRGVAYRGRLAGIGLVQVVMVHEHWRDGRWSPWVALATDRLDLTAAEVVTVYLQRWAVEVLHRDAKQNLGLTDCQMRSLEGTVRHWTLAFLSQGLLMLLRLQADRGELRSPSGAPVATVGRTVGEVRHWVQERALEELVRWVHAQAAAGQAVEAVLGPLQMLA
jgi:hypothetical protein